MTEKKSKYSIVHNENKYFQKSNDIQKSMQLPNKYFQKSNVITKSMSGNFQKTKRIPPSGGDTPSGGSSGGLIGNPIEFVSFLLDKVGADELKRQIDLASSIIDELEPGTKGSLSRAVSAMPDYIQSYIRNKMSTTGRGLTAKTKEDADIVYDLLSSFVTDVVDAYSYKITEDPSLLGTKPKTTPVITSEPLPSVADFERTSTYGGVGGKETSSAETAEIPSSPIPTDLFPNTLTENQRAALSSIASMSREEVLSRIKNYGPNWIWEPIKSLKTWGNRMTEKSPRIAEILQNQFEDGSIENPWKVLEDFLGNAARSGILDRDKYEMDFYTNPYLDTNQPFKRQPDWSWKQMEGSEKIKDVGKKVAGVAIPLGLGAAYYGAQQNNPYWTEEWKDSDPSVQLANLQNLNAQMGKPARDWQKQPSFTDVYIPWGKPSINKSQVKKKEKNNKINKAGGTGSDAVNISPVSTGGSGGSGGSGGLSSQQALSTAQQLSQFLSRINPLIKKYGVKTAEAIMKKTPGLYEKYKAAYSNPIVQTVINQKPPEVSAPNKKTLTDKKELKNYAINAAQSKLAQEAMQNPITRLGMKVAQPAVSALFSPLIVFDKAKSDIAEAYKPTTKKEQAESDVINISDAVSLVSYGDLRQQQNAINTSKENRVKMQNKLVGNLKVPDYIQSSRNLRPLTDKEKKERDTNYKTYLGQLKEVWERAKTYEPGTTLSTSDKLSNSMSDNYVSGLGVANRSKVNLASAESRDRDRKKNQQMAMDYMSGKFKPKTIQEKVSVDMGINALNREKAESAKQTARAQAKQEKDRKRTDEMAARASSMRSPQPNKKTTAIQPTPQPQKPNKPKRVIAQTKSPYQLQAEAQARNNAQNRAIQNQIAQVITQQGVKL